MSKRICLSVVFLLFWCMSASALNSTLLQQKYANAPIQVWSKNAVVESNIMAAQIELRSTMTNMINIGETKLYYFVHADNISASDMSVDVWYLADSDYINYAAETIKYSISIKDVPEFELEGKKVNKVIEMTFDQINLKSSAPVSIEFVMYKTDAYTTCGDFNKSDDWSFIKDDLTGTASYEINPNILIIEKNTEDLLFGNSLPLEHCLITKTGMAVKSIEFENRTDADAFFSFRVPSKFTHDVGDGFRVYNYENFMEKANKDVILFEKTDGNQENPDGGIAFTTATNTESTPFKREVTMMLEGNGNVGVGTAEPLTKLHVKKEGDEQPTMIVEQVNCASGPNLALVGSEEDGSNHSGMRLEYRTDARELRFQECNSAGKYVGHAATIKPNGDLLAKGTITSEGDIIAANGSVTAKEFKVGTWVITDAPDFVFDKDYDLKSLTEVETFINKESHLPGIPSAEQIKTEGLDLVKMNMLLLQKVEELTLYSIEQQKNIASQQKKIESLEIAIDEMK